MSAASSSATATAFLNDAWSTASAWTPRERLERLAWFLDSAFRVPGTEVRFGADAVLGLVPGLGNAATTLLSAYLIHEAWRSGVPKAALARMAGNVALDSLFTAVPLVGTVADLFWRANRRNMAILARHLDDAANREAAR